MRVCEARFLTTSGHSAEKGKEYHMSVCNDILDNAFCVHSNKMVKLNSTKVPAVSKNTIYAADSNAKARMTGISTCQYKDSLCCTVLFLTV
jgi:hypothetical protein